MHSLGISAFNTLTVSRNFKEFRAGWVHMLLACSIYIDMSMSTYVHMYMCLTTGTFVLGQIR